MTKKKKSSCNPAAAAATAKVVRAAAARAKAQIAIKAQRGDPPVPRANHQLPRSMATGKDGKVKAVILGFLPVADLPTPPLPPAPKITNAEVYARVFGGWYLVGKMPKHAMELGGDKTLDFMIMLGVDRRCPDLPIELGDRMRMLLATNSFLAVLSRRLNLTDGLFGEVVKRSPGFGNNPGVLCGHFEVFIMGLYESNGVGAAYKFLWGIFEAYGPFILDRIIADSRRKHRYTVPQVARWKKLLFTPEKDDALDANDYTRLGPWLFDALRMHGQEIGRPFELLERERTVANAQLRECAVVSDGVAIAVTTAATATEAKQAAVSEALSKLDFFGNIAANLLYAYADQCGVEVEFSIGRYGQKNVFSACVHWGNGDDSKVIGRALRASSIESQGAAAVLAARKLNLSLTEFARSGRVYVIGTSLEDEDEGENYAVEIGPSGPVIVL